MNFRVFGSALLAALVLVGPLAMAGEQVAKPVSDKLRAALEVPGMSLKVDTVSSSEIPGLYQVQFLNGPLVYASADGKYFVVGDMYTVQGGTYVNLAEKRRDGQRADKLAAIAKEDMIVFSPEGELKGQITVFTDVTCFYCQKLHREVPELNKRGVEVRYLAYPRAGADSDGFRKLASAWCADNPQEALTRLKNKQSVPSNVCDGNPIAAQFQLGQEMGVRGTPAIVMQDGTMIPGYQSAKDLTTAMGIK